MENSIFEFADKFNLKSPFVKWTKDKFDDLYPKITSIKITNSLSIYNSDRNDNFDLFINIDNSAEKVEVFFDNIKRTANINYNLSTLSLGNYFISLYNILPPPYQMKEFIFEVRVFGVGDILKVADSKCYVVTLTIDGQIIGGVFKETEILKKQKDIKFPNTEKKSKIKVPEDYYKDKTIEGSTFPNDPYNYDVKINLSNEIQNIYIPTLEKDFPTLQLGLKNLMIIMANIEGFYKGTRSFKNNNPGNIGNTDSGANKKLTSLTEGIKLQQDYIVKVSNGNHKSYPLNKQKKIEPYYSPEIAKNKKNYGLSPYLPGYNFLYIGQLDQFAKIYSTGARGSNSYINSILSFFKLKGIYITPEYKLQDIITIV